eukprot:TRINITY_DN1128_c1_g2_i2.p1 TRINITY_DN1128_c1_g2~~TRINITY_DN1128_c1_g2_i2.p1  ORF type:complete len:291 (+),score=25.77 TRINITY_DN1128_c1_g2_i2:234-1106(+)
MGIDPVTHKPKSDTLSSSVDGQCKNAANLSHMAQWESARLEAEARLVRESKLRSNSNSNSTSIQPQLGCTSASAPLQNNTAAPWAPPPLLDVLKAWQGVWSNSTKGGVAGIGGGVRDLESPTSTLSFSENSLPIPTVGIGGENLAATIEIVGNLSLCQGGDVKEEAEEDWKGFGKGNYPSDYGLRMENLREFTTTVTTTSGLGDVVFSLEGGPWSPESSRTTGNRSSSGPASKPDFIDGFTNLLLENTDNHDRSSSDGGDSENAEDLENKNYWNNILELVNSSPSNSPVF